jgi:hypothetical protein
VEGEIFIESWFMLVFPGIAVMMDVVVYVQLCKAKIFRVGD